MTPADRIVPEVEALILAELARRVKARVDVVRAIVGTCYQNGDKHSFRSPIDDTKLGSVYKTDPDPKWQVVDRLSLNAWLLEQDAYTETTVQIEPGREAEAYAVLAEHSPDLLVDFVEVREGAVDEVLAECARQRRAVAPGIKLVQPEGVLTVKPAPTAGQAVAAMLKAGLIEWDGRPALDAGDAA